MSRDTSERLKREILEFLKQKPGTSFVELSKLAGFKGDLAITAEEDHNLVYWIGCSSAAVHALQRLMTAGSVVIRQASILLYLVDGGMIRLPIAKQPSRRYSRPHWLPVVLDLPSEYPRVAARGRSGAKGA